MQGRLVKLELNIIEGHESLILLDDGVMRLDENIEEHLLVESLHRAQDGQTTEELRNETVLLEVFDLDALENVTVLVVVLAHGGAKAHARALVEALLDDVVQTGEGATADEENVARVDGGVLREGRLHATRKRHLHRRALKHLEQALLDGFATDITTTARALGTAIALGDLVDLVNVDDAMLGTLDIALGCGDELGDDALDVIADVTGLGKRGRIRDGQRHIEQIGERLDDVGLARARGAEHEDVALVDLNIALLRRVIALVVVVCRHGHDLLRELLSDDVFIDLGLELVRLGNGRHDGLALLALGLLHGRAHAKGAAAATAREKANGTPATKGAIAGIVVGVLAVDGLAVDFLDLVALLVGSRARGLVVIGILPRHGEPKELRHLVDLALEASGTYGRIGRQRHKRAAGFLFGLAAEAAAPIRVAGRGIGHEMVPSSCGLRAPAIENMATILPHLSCDYQDGQ